MSEQRVAEHLVLVDVDEDLVGPAAAENAGGHDVP